MEDTYVLKGLRKKMIEELREKGISSESVLDAMFRVPRHFFMNKGFEKLAYKDLAYPIAAGQTISQPYTVAFQTQLLQVSKGDKVLEIGTGSGYQTAVLLELGVKVFTIERQRELFLASQALLEKLGYRPHYFFGDGYLGQPTYAPFDRIIVTAGAPFIPEDLEKQLKPGGRMVIPVGNQLSQKMILVEKKSESDIERTENGNFLFVPLIQGKNQ